MINEHSYNAVGSDYSPPSGRFEVEAGENRACLNFTIFDDGIVEGMESIRGMLQGIIDPVTNTLITSPERITFQPDEATLNILDTDSMLILYMC